ncbi:MAG: cellulase family glycosylhydrolase [Clostridia bacterium]|nr:cellulase family glycosylhydrolase [Clostridia bacterium]
MRHWKGFERGMGIGGWLTNYKRFNVLSREQQLKLTIGDFEHFASYITERDVAYISSLGMDHIRLGIDQLVVEEEEGKYRSEIMEHIDRFVGWCEKYGLGIVLNMHKAIGNYCDIKEDVGLLDDEGLQRRFISFWKYFESHYAQKPEIVFELLNEALDVPKEKWNALMRRTVEAIRAMNPTRRIIIGSTVWNSPDKLCELDYYENDENIGYTFHIYAPNEFTHQRGVLQQPQCFYNRDMPYPGDIDRYRDFMKTVWGRADAYEQYDRMDKRFMADRLEPAFEFHRQHPDAFLWCGEFGTIRHAKMEWREAWMRDVISLLKEHDVPYSVWNYLSTPNDGNRFSLVDDDRREILSEEMARIIRGEV